MSLVHLQFESLYLHNNTDVNIILPDNPRAVTPAAFYGSGRKYKVLWLLHGTFGDYSDWLRKSNIELYATERDLIVVMPSGLNADYSNWANFCLGYQSLDYLFEELMPLVYNWYPASSRPEDNFIAGLSMGGEGTLRYLLAHPEKFAAAASLSYVPTNYDDPVYRKELEQTAGASRAELEKAAGTIPMNADGNLRLRNEIDKEGGLEAFLASDMNQWKMFEAFAKLKNPPRLFFSCGDEDEFFGVNGKYPAFLKYMDSLHIAYTHSEGAGHHDWRVWERDIQLALDFFDIKNQNLGNAF